jgi:GxxExxY protein
VRDSEENPPTFPRRSYMNNTIIHKELSDRILGLAMTVHRNLGPCSSGFYLSPKGKKPELPAESESFFFLEMKLSDSAELLESAYEEAMVWELRHAGIPFKRQQVFPLKYKGDYISSYIADLVVDNKVILELKFVKAMDNNLEAQLINYLRLSKISVGYLLNFQNVRLEWKRFVC